MSGQQTGVLLGVGIPILVMGCMCWGFMRLWCRQNRKQTNRQNVSSLPPSSNSASIQGQTNNAYVPNSPGRTSNSLNIQSPGDTVEERSASSDVFYISSPSVFHPPPPYTVSAVPADPPPAYTP